MRKERYKRAKENVNAQKQFHARMDGMTIYTRADAIAVWRIVNGELQRKTANKNLQRENSIEDNK